MAMPGHAAPGRNRDCRLERAGLLRDKSVGQAHRVQKNAVLRRLKWQPSGVFAGCWVSAASMSLAPRAKRTIGVNPENVSAPVHERGLWILQRGQMSQKPWVRWGLV